jgi:hypothetical protein
VIQILDANPRLLEAELDSMAREVRVVLLPREALFLGRRDDLAIDDQGRRRVMVKGRNAEDRSHGCRLSYHSRRREPDLLIERLLQQTLSACALHGR